MGTAAEDGERRSRDAAADGGERRSAAAEAGAPDAGAVDAEAGVVDAEAGAADGGWTPDPAGYRLRVLAAVLIGVEAAGLVAAAVFLLVLAVVSSHDSPAQLVSLAVIAVIVGGGLALCARGVLGGLRWTRGPVLTWQLLQAAIGAPLTTSGAWWAGVPLLAVAVVVGILILGPYVVTQPSRRF